MIRQSVLSLIYLVIGKPETWDDKAEKMLEIEQSETTKYALLSLEFALDCVLIFLFGYVVVMLVTHPWRAEDALLALSLGMLLAPAAFACFVLWAAKAWDESTPDDE